MNKKSKTTHNKIRRHRKEVIRDAWLDYLYIRTCQSLDKQPLCHIPLRNIAKRDSGLSGQHCSGRHTAVINIYRSIRR